MLSTSQLSTTNTFAIAAVKCVRELSMNPLFADLSLAQALLESAYGTRVTGANNIFGIKADSFNSLGSTSVPTHETFDSVSKLEPLRFQNYSSLEECFRDHARIFLSGPLSTKYSIWDKSHSPLYSLVVAISPPSPSPLYATSPAYCSSISSMLAMRTSQNALTLARLV